jgi:hypothetical protein
LIRVLAEMAERIEGEKLEAMSKKELVDLIQSVAPLDLLQSNRSHTSQQDVNP